MEKIEESLALLILLDSRLDEKRIAIQSHKESY